MSETSIFAAFNSPFELGLRMVYLLSAIGSGGADIQKLVLLDYAILYSLDLGGPKSLHTPVPYRGTEVMSRRELIQQGLYLMSTRGLVGARIDETGITYVAGPSARTMTGALTSVYFLELEQRCQWAAKEFASTDSAALTSTFAENGHRWGAEVEARWGTRETQWPSS